jgi:hypothetical protein
VADEFNSHTKKTLVGQPQAQPFGLNNECDVGPKGRMIGSLAILSNDSEIMF